MRGDSTVPITGRMSQPPIPFGSASAEACETSVISAPYSRVGTARRTASALLDLNGPPDLLQYRRGSFNEASHHSSQLFPVLCADFKVLSRGVVQKSRISQR